MKSDSDGLNASQRSSRFDYDGDLRSEKSVGSVMSGIFSGRSKEVPKEEPSKKELLIALERLTNSVHWFVNTADFINHLN